MNNQSYRIEIANESNSYDIATINALAWQRAYHGIIPENELNSISINSWHEEWSNALKQGALVLTISHCDKVVGFSQICKDNSKLNVNCGEINSLYLHPTIWRKGFGKQLCEAALLKLKQLGFEYAELWVLSELVPI